MTKAMGTRGYHIVRFRGRYYIRHKQYDSYYEGLGRQVVDSIPSDPEHYQGKLFALSCTALHVLTSRRMAPDDARPLCG